MLKHKQADGTVAFHLNLSRSKGTRNMVEQTVKAGKPVWTSEMGIDKLPEFIMQLKKRIE